ncbi:hypothetical protein SADUNF_Sadunf12G0070700 [Salix dunnii]|uniref:C3H1-type domain-containing protein n=1 Tax=Salix dunnii TaxID=1413687 RepID=A0A835MN47_9ROSI|nr:hypothetical protein SADUNF_Sadunf12G0070700 [Salix dunnii]
MDQQIDAPSPIIHNETPQLGFQFISSSPRDPSSSSDPDQKAHDDDNHLHQELQNQLDLKEEFPNSNDSHEEEEEEEEEELKSDKKSRVFHEAESIEKAGNDGDDLENTNERSNDYENNNSSRSHQYPVRPEADDCAFYMKTGTCKFEANCKFNHPLRRRNQTVKDKVKEREEATEKPSLTECKVILMAELSTAKRKTPTQTIEPGLRRWNEACLLKLEKKMSRKYYLKTGGCKYGKACRFNHSRAKNSVAPLKIPISPAFELNFLGLPIRLGEKECEFYMRNGSCKFGANCKYNHPDPTAVGGSDHPPTFLNGGSASLPAPSPSSVGSWSSPRALNDPSSFIPIVFSPNQGVPPQSPDWNGYQAPLYPPERSLHPPLSYALINLATESNVYAPQQQQIVVDEFPERPGQPQCSFYMRFGDCKFKSNCKFHHPKNRISQSPPLTLNDKGLPLRPDQNICSHYSRYGICKFGPACKFDHSIQPASSIGSSDDQNTAFGNAVTQEAARMAESGNGSDTAVEQPV